MLSSEEILEIFQASGALLEGHFRLTSGLHSSKYIQCALVLQYPEYATQLCSQLALSFRKTEADLVIGPALGGIIVSQEVGKALGIRAIFAERDQDNRLTLRRGFKIKEGERAIVVEDVITTGGSLKETMEVVRARGGKVVGAGALVDRSDGKAQLGLPYYTLIELQTLEYPAQDCPLCKEGKEVVKPGSRK